MTLARATPLKPQMPVIRVIISVVRLRLTVTSELPNSEPRTRTVTVTVDSELAKLEEGHGSPWHGENPPPASANQTVTILYKRLYNLYNLYNFVQRCT